LDGRPIAKGAKELTLIELGKVLESGRYDSIGMASQRGRRMLSAMLWISDRRREVEE
jgi:hypothetical protein